MADAGTVALSVVTVLGTLGGAWLGARLQATRQASEWWRNERKAAFVDLLTGLDRFQFALVPLNSAIQKASPDELREGLDTMMKTLAGIDSAISVLLLLVPQINEAELREVFEACLNEMGDVADLARAKGVPDSELKGPTNMSANMTKPRGAAMNTYEAHQRVVKMAHQFLPARPARR